MLLHYLGKLKFSADTQPIWKKMQTNKHFECIDLNSVDLHTWLNEKSGEQPSFDTATETISDLLNVGRQRSKRSAAMLR